MRSISVIIALTGGTAHKTTDGISVELDDDGNTLCISEVWGQQTQSMNVFYAKFPKRGGESQDDFDRRRFQMVTTMRKMKLKYSDEDGNMVSTYRLDLPFRVEPTEKRIHFIGDKTGGRYCHVDLIEKKLQEVHSVQLIGEDDDDEDDDGRKKQSFVTPAKKKSKYCS